MVISLSLLGMLGCFEAGLFSRLEQRFRLCLHLSTFFSVFIIFSSLKARHRKQAVVACRPGPGLVESMEVLAGITAGAFE